MKLLLISICALVLSACVCPDGPVKSKRSGKSYYPTKVCTIGDTDGTTCVEYAVQQWEFPNSGTIMLTTLDQHKYIFNLAGWAIIITRE